MPGRHHKATEWSFHGNSNQLDLLHQFRETRGHGLFHPPHSYRTRKFERDLKSPCFMCPCGLQCAAWEPVPVQASQFRPTGPNTPLQVVALEKSRPPCNGKESTKRRWLTFLSFLQAPLCTAFPRDSLSADQAQGAPHTPAPQAPPGTTKVAELAQGWGGGRSRAAREQLPSQGIAHRGREPHTGLFQAPLSTTPQQGEQPPGRVQRRCRDPARSLASHSGTRLCNPVLSWESLPRWTPTRCLAECPQRGFGPPNSGSQKSRH